MNTAPKFLFVLTAVAALSTVYPTSVQAVPTTYKYTGNPFTFAISPYTTSDFVSGMVTLAGPLGANMGLTDFTPIAFTLFDGVQTLSSTTPDIFGTFRFATNARGEINFWLVDVFTSLNEIETVNFGPLDQIDSGFTTDNFAQNSGSPGVWTTPDAGSTLSLMTLTLMALGLVARRFQRATG